MGKKGNENLKFLSMTWEVKNFWYGLVLLNWLE